MQGLDAIVPRLMVQQIIRVPRLMKINYLISQINIACMPQPEFEATERKVSTEQMLHFNPVGSCIGRSAGTELSMHAAINDS